jgi:hypothetical protein
MEVGFCIILLVACHAVSDCVNDCNDLRKNIDEHVFFI